MNLENVTAVLRPRSPWEAADFGARLLRRDGRAIYRVWFSVTLPLLSIGLAIAAFSPFPALGAIVYWWLEPIVDGPILHILSRRLFGDDADVRGTLRAVPRLAWINRIFWLTPYRFHVARSTAMPLTQLEGLRGKARRSRAAVMNRRILNNGFGLTMAYQHLAVALYFGIILIVYALIPPAYQETAGAGWLGQFWSDGSRVGYTVGLLITWSAQTALEPWFVAAGFGMYVNCRTRMEAWDLEVAFRRLVQRREAPVAATAALAVCLLATLQPAVSWGQDQEPKSTEKNLSTDSSEEPSEFGGYWADDEVRPLVDDVMASDALRLSREVEVWQPIDPVEEADAPDSALVALLQAIGRMLSLGIELMLWAAAAGLCIWAALRLRKWRPDRGRPGGPALQPRRIALAGGEIVAVEDLPVDVPTAALQCWHNGEARQALSLLYRGALLRAVARYNLRLPDAATEGMCVAAVDEQTDAQHAAFFRQLVETWSACAYGGQTPAADVVPTLCAEWQQQYAAVA